MLSDKGLKAQSLTLILNSLRFKPDGRPSKGFLEACWASMTVLPIPPTPVKIVNRPGGHEPIRRTVSELIQHSRARADQAESLPLLGEMGFP
jgi:hypothetical protein